MHRLQIQLILRLLTDALQVGPQRCLSNTFGIVLVILLALHERLGVLGRNYPWLKTQFTERATNKMRAEACLHADDAARQLLENVNERQTLDLASKNDLPVPIETDDVKNILANIDADRRELLFRFCFASIAFA